MSARAGVLLALGAALAACGGAERTAPDPASGDEARAVAEAAEMLEERQPQSAPARDDGNK
ncbi:MAG: hypothetical protein JY451_05340 [Erythrobacter sp.]|nr:MAG: hypothetical protein JY451_05340 [Erythrobacter sp.]